MHSHNEVIQCYRFTYIYLAEYDMILMFYNL